MDHWQTRTRQSASRKLGSLLGGPCTSQRTSGDSERKIEYWPANKYRSINCADLNLPPVWGGLLASGQAQGNRGMRLLTVSFLSVEINLALVKICFTSVSVVGMGMVVLFTKWLSSFCLQANTWDIVLPTIPQNVQVLREPSITKMNQKYRVGLPFLNLINNINMYN